MPLGLAAGGELGDRAARGGFGGLAAGVGVDLRIEHQDVDVAAGGDDVIEAAVADVVGPAVAAHDPDALYTTVAVNKDFSRHAERVRCAFEVRELLNSLDLGADHHLCGAICTDSAISSRVRILHPTLA